MNQLLSVGDLSNQLKVHPCTIYRLVDKGQIPHIRLNGRNLRFRKDDLDTWLDTKAYKQVADFGLATTFLADSLTPSLENDRKSPGGFGEMAKAKSKTRFNFGYGAIYQRKTRDGRIRWYLDYRDAEGKRIQKVEDGASSSQEAEFALKKTVLAEAARVPGALRKRGRITFTEFSQIFFNDYSMNVKRSWRSDKSRLGILESFFKDIYLDELTPLMIQKCLAWRMKSGNSKSTSNRYLALLKKMFSLAIEEGYVEENPSKKIKKHSEKEFVRDRILTEDEEAKLKKACYPVLLSILNVALNTGLRVGEILGLKWELIDLSRMTLTVEKTKSGKPLTLPINAALYKELLRLKSQNGKSDYVFLNPKTGKPFTTVKTAFKAACRRAGISGLTFHGLRHTTGTRLIQKGADIETVRTLLGHSSIAVTQRYVHSTDERRRSAVERLAETTTSEPRNGANLLHGCDTAGKSSAAESRRKAVTMVFSAN